MWSRRIAVPQRHRLVVVLGGLRLTLLDRWAAVDRDQERGSWVGMAAVKIDSTGRNWVGKGFGNEYKRQSGDC
jgi:hypothetical protein